MIFSKMLMNKIMVIWTIPFPKFVLFLFEGGIAWAPLPRVSPCTCSTLGGIYPPTLSSLSSFGSRWTSCTRTSTPTSISAQCSWSTAPLQRWRCQGWWSSGTLPTARMDLGAACSRFCFICRGGPAWFPVSCWWGWMDIWWFARTRITTSLPPEGCCCRSRVQCPRMSSHTPT